LVFDRLQQLWQADGLGLFGESAGGGVAVCGGAAVWADAEGELAGGIVLTGPDPAEGIGAADAATLITHPESLCQGGR
jgi:hypothetical protein